jgi:hypothetical protein
MNNKTLAIIFFSIVFVACGNHKQPSSNTVGQERKGYTNIDQLTEERLRRLDSLDNQFYSNQAWDSFAISHDDNIKAYYPDGTTTTGLFPQHIDMLKPMFVFSPETKVISHPVKFGTGDWTCTIGEVEGTFSKPMPVGNGKTIPPTEKKFKFTMCTVGHWINGKMIEEYLFWDNQAILKQIGLANQ